MAYIDYSMSVNAATAYSEGKKPLSQFTTADMPDGWTLAAAKRAAKCEAWIPCEWHHTSCKYNKTDFYDVADLNELNPNDFPSVRKSKTQSEIAVTVTWQDWSQGRRRYVECKSEGIRRGNWIYLPSGKKLSVNRSRIQWSVNK